MIMCAIPHSRSVTFAVSSEFLASLEAERRELEIETGLHVCRSNLVRRLLTRGLDAVARDAA